MRNQRFADLCPDSVTNCYHMRRNANEKPQSARSYQSVEYFSKALPRRYQFSHIQRSSPLGRFSSQNGFINLDQEIDRHNFQYVYALIFSPESYFFDVLRT